MIFKKTVASEQTHWYDKDGNPVYEVPKAKGDGMRATTLADARKLSLVPSVTTILKVAAKPGLEEWKLQQAMLSALTMPRLPDEADDTFIARLVADSKEQASQAAAIGTSIHSALEKAYEGEEFNSDFVFHVEAVKNAVFETFGNQNWTAEKSFACHLGYGGKVDLCSDSVVIDFKTTAFDEDKKDVGGYDEHLMQGAAYAMGLAIADPIVSNVYVSTSVPGLVRVKVWTDEEVKRGWEMFNLLRQYWFVSKGYTPC